MAPRLVEQRAGVPEQGSALPPQTDGDFAIEDDDGEEDGDYAMTEDDPVDLAMRVATADRMEMDDDEEDEDDEEIVFRPSLSLSSSQIMQNQFVHPSLSSFWD